MTNKISFLVLLAFCIISCSSDSDNANSNENQIQLVNTLTHTNNLGVSRELRFTYNNENNVTRIETDNYFKTFSYADGRITKLESVDFPNTPYYTIDFTYSSNGGLINVKRTNHYNGTEKYVDYNYKGDGRIDRICIYDNEQDFIDNFCDRYYDISYRGATTNYNEKTHYVPFGSASLEVPTKWEYDNNKRPYFGEALNQISLPYATNGIEIDWEIIYSLNNPTLRQQKNNAGQFVTSKTFEYTYDSKGYPINMQTKSYNIDNGALTGTLNVKATYMFR